MKITLKQMLSRSRKRHLSSVGRTTSRVAISLSDR